MKKTIVCIMLFVFVFTAAGCTENTDSFEQKSYSIDVSEIKGLDIDVRDRSIDVSISPDNQIHIDYSESDKEYYDISVSDDKVLTVSYESSKKWSDYIGSKPSEQDRKITLQIPEATFSFFSISTTNEDIDLPELIISDEIYVETNNGDLDFSNLKSDSITLKSKNGDINGMVCGNYEDYSIKCSIKKGESNLPSEKNEGTKKLDVSCNNGDVNIDFFSD